MHRTQKSRNIKILNYVRQEGTLVALISLFIFSSLYFDVFFTALNLSNIFRQVSMIGLISIGMTFVILTGGIDLSVGAIVAVSAVTAANLSGEFILLPVLIPIIIGAFIGAINGLIIAKLRIQPFIATLAIMLAARGIAFIISKGEAVRAQRLGDSFLQIARGDILGIPNFGIIFISVLIVSAIVLNYTSFGRSVYAIGGNEEAATMMGLNVFRGKVLVYTISGALAGTAGMLLASRLGSGQPYAGEGWELQAIAAVVIGGTLLTGGVGRINGTLYGVLILGIIANSLNLVGNVPYWYANLITGFLLLVVILIQTKIARN
jgi:ribose/xylose/arabinose/galactoside ABC-type transport system permease subunit